MGKFINKTDKNAFKTLLNISLISLICYFLIGLLTTFIYFENVKSIGILLGIITLTIALITGIKYLKNDGSQLYRFNIIFSIFEVIISVLFFINNYESTTILKILLGILFIVLGLNKIMYAYLTKMGNESSWNIILGMGSMILLIGIVLLFVKFANFNINSLVGIFLMLYSVLDIGIILLFKKRYQNFIKIFW